MNNQRDEHTKEVLEVVTLLYAKHGFHLVAVLADANIVHAMSDCLDFLRCLVLFVNLEGVGSDMPKVL